MNRGLYKKSKKRLIIYLSVFVSIVCLAILLYAVFWPAQNNRTDLDADNADLLIESPTRYNLIISIQELLDRRYDSITALDEKYSMELNNANDETILNEINGQINLEEELLSKTIDSLNSNKPDNADENYLKLYNAVIASYHSVLRGRAAISSLRTVIKLQKTAMTTPGEVEPTGLQKELQERDARIALLKTMLKTLDERKRKKLP